MRKIFSVVLCIAMFFAMSSVAFAKDMNASQSSSIQILSQAVSNVNYAESPHYKLLTPAIANSTPVVIEWFNSISKVNGGVINPISFTSASGTADRIEVTYYLQQSKNGSSWNDYYSTVRSLSKTSQFSDSFENSITPGYYYRLITYHRVYMGSTCTSTQTATSGNLYF
jgi:hypothetical protein